MGNQSVAEKRQAKLNELVESNGYDADDPRAARDVPQGECWAFTDHRTMAEIVAEGLL